MCQTWTHVNQAKHLHTIRFSFILNRCHRPTRNIFENETIDKTLVCITELFYSSCIMHMLEITDQTELQSRDSRRPTQGRRHSFECGGIPTVCIDRGTSHETEHCTVFTIAGLIMTSKRLPAARGRGRWRKVGGQSPWQSPQRGPGQRPWSGGLGAKPPRSWSFFFVSGRYTEQAREKV